MKEGLAQNWKDSIEAFLNEVYSFQDAVAFVSQYYFDGYQMLFSDLVKVLSDVIDSAGKLVGIFNDDIADGTEQYEQNVVTIVVV